MAVRSGEGLGGPQSRSARTRPSDSQQVYAGDSGHSSGVGSRTLCLVLYRHGQVVAPPVKPTVGTSSVGPDERLARTTLPAASLQHILRETADNTLCRHPADPSMKDRSPDSGCNFPFIPGCHSPDDDCSRIANLDSSVCNNLLCECEYVQMQNWSTTIISLYANYFGRSGSDVIVVDQLSCKRT